MDGGGLILKITKLPERPLGVASLLLIILFYLALEYFNASEVYLRFLVFVVFISFSIFFIVYFLRPIILQGDGFGEQEESTPGKPPNLDNAQRASKAMNLSGLSRLRQFNKIAFFSVLATVFLFVASINVYNYAKCHSNNTIKERRICSYLEAYFHPLLLSYR